jgi:hypothetical protein
MTRWIVIATLRRGRLDPPEPVNEASQAKLEEQRNEVHGTRLLPARANRNQEICRTLRFGGEKRWSH